MNYSKDQQISDTLEGESIVFRYIQQQIISGNLKAGDKLPSERALSQVLNVSRGYVRGKEGRDAGYP